MKFWICRCGYVNDDDVWRCIKCKGSRLFTNLVYFNSVQKLKVWIERMNTTMGAKLWRD